VSIKTCKSSNDERFKTHAHFCITKSAELIAKKQELVNNSQDQKEQRIDKSNKHNDNETKRNKKAGFESHKGDNVSMNTPILHLLIHKALKEKSYHVTIESLSSLLGISIEFLKKITLQHNDMRLNKYKQVSITLD